MPKDRVKGVIFDFDGVVADSEPWWEEADRRLMEENGAVLRPEAKFAVIGLKQEVSIRKLVEMHGIKGDPDRLMARREQMMREYYSERIELNPTVGETLARLCELGVTMAVATSTPKRLVEVCIARHGIGGYFRRVVSAEEVANGKPAPDVFLKALSHLTLTPEKVLVIEDSKPGLIGARAAGMLAVWLRNDFQPDAEGYADRVVESVAGLLEMIS